MSLLADLFDAVRPAAAVRGETLPPMPFTGRGGGWLGNSGARPQRGQLDLTTAESTLYSVLDLISGDVGTVGWGLYRGPRMADMAAPEGVEPLTAAQHLAVKLWDNPNSFMTGEHLRTMCAWHFDSVGEAWVVCDYNALGIPQSFWPVRPDRMDPTTSPDKYLLGYSYTSPDGEKIPLKLNEVLRITRPHPIDPHRGIGPVPALMTPLTTSLTTQQWIDAFYRNDATPGAVIELGNDELLDDDDYDAFVQRWDEQHRGVNRSHRVGILEIGTFKPLEVNFKDLQVTELRQLTRDQVLEAYQLNKFMIGATDDVNRAASLAANDTYARRVLTRRLRYWHAFANGPFLACFGSAGRGVTWCPENVIPEDEEAANAERDSMAAAVKSYVDAGYSRAEIADMFNLPLTAGQADPELLSLLAQKLYLAVGNLGDPNVVLSTIEARRIMAMAGAVLDPWTPTQITGGAP